MKNGKTEEGNVAKDIISILLKPASIREIVANRTVADGVKFFIAVSILYWLVGTVINVSKFGNEGLLLSLLEYPAADFCFIFAFVALIGYFYRRKGYEVNHTNIYTCIFYAFVPMLVFFWLDVFEDSIVYLPLLLVSFCWSMYLLIKALGAYLDNQYENFKTVVYSFLLFWGVVFIVVIIAGVITGLFFRIDIFEGGDFADTLLSSILLIFTCLLIGAVFSAIKPSEIIRHEMITPVKSIKAQKGNGRPVTIVIAAVIFVIFGIIEVIGSGIRIRSMMGYLGIIDSIAGIFMMLGIMDIVAGYGLWCLKKYGGILGIILCTISTIHSLITIDISSLALNIIVIVLIVSSWESLT